MAEKKAADISNVTETVYLQFGGEEVSLSQIRNAVNENYNSVKKGKDEPVDIKIYLKPEDGKAYYVINDDYAGEVELFHAS